ncbi:MAG: toxin-antitoxin system protein [Acidobacteria bacterium]|nr:toxin-antitoxin system protein [Acidobacteriota bacterium]
MPKLTLSVDESVVSRAKSYARRRGTSVSKLVENYLKTLAAPAESGEDPPILRSLRGILKKGDREAYRKHLADKYL